MRAPLPSFDSYVTNYNATMEKYADAEAKGDTAAMIALQPAIKFNGGGHVNHRYRPLHAVQSQRELIISPNLASFGPIWPRLARGAAANPAGSWRISSTLSSARLT